MPRRASFVSLMNAMARDAARSQRQAEAARRSQERERLRAIRAAERADAAATKEARQRYLDDRINEAAELNRELAQRVSELAGVLEQTLTVDDRIDFDSLRVKDAYPPFEPPPEIANPVPPPKQADYLSKVKPPSFPTSLIPGAKDRHLHALARAQSDYEQAIQRHAGLEGERQARLVALRAQYDTALSAFRLKVAQRDKEVEELTASYMALDPATVVAYNNMVLERSTYPEGFPQEFRIAYVPESKQLVVDYELPGPDIAPPVAEYKYVKGKDEIEEKQRKASDKKQVYQDLVASIALRTCHEVFEADQANAMETVAFNGFVQTVDPATGKDIRPYLISVRTTKERFAEIDLSRVDKLVCLRNLGAQVSPRPSEVQAVKPIVEFDMVDKRFVEQSDVLADLDARPNLMDLNPFEFENLIANLFKQIGLETKLTRSSRDGGVDVVAYDTRPVIGGKVVIQAKRYKNTVGVSAVRDLYGTMLNEGANKGILVTTSGYGPDAFDFAKDKPIELMDGGQLLYLLDQVGVKARIIMPDDAPP